LRIHRSDISKLLTGKAKAVIDQKTPPNQQEGISA
jgi:hypothetical protein